jgi:flagellar biosynthetic protein FlhB
MRASVARAFSKSLGPGELIVLLQTLTVATMKPLALLGAVLVALTILLQAASTNIGLSFARLAPKMSRLNPMGKLKDLPSNNLMQLLQACVMIPVMLWVTWALVRARLPEMMSLPLMPIAVAAAATGQLVHEALKKASLALVLLGFVMLVRDRAKYSKRLRMSKQEIKDESKESEGSPHVKAKIRKFQRDLRRKNQMKDVASATAIIVNPTHYAVALKYDHDGLTAPRVVAKGRNYLAARIRLRATENQVPIIENPPLAQALYKSVEVGQEIPPHLYRAVAEILAYVFKLTNPGAGRTR